MGRTSEARSLHRGLHTGLTGYSPVLCTSMGEDGDVARRARARARPALHGERARPRVWEPTMSGAILVSPCAEARLASAAAWLAARTEPHVTIVGASIEAAAEVARRALGLERPPAAAAGALPTTRASFGWQRSTLGVLAVGIARTELAKLGLVPVGGLALEAVCARVVHDQHRGSAKKGGAAKSKLGRFAAIGDLPGLPRALARTVAELRLAGDATLARLEDPDLARLVKAFEAELEAAGLADRARTLAIATELVARLDPAQLGAILLVDVALRSRAERDFVAALAARAPGAFAIVPAGDDRALALLEIAFRGVNGPAQVEHLAPSSSPASMSSANARLARLHEGLFGPGQASTPLSIADGNEVEILSAPGESRECVEIARLVLAEAAKGTKLDRIAVLLRAPQYSAHLEEALGRAGIPAYFARGTRKPDAAGRAMLALLACAAEGLSARRFAEYLSLGEVPEEGADGAPPDSRSECRGCRLRHCRNAESQPPRYHAHLSD